MPRTHVVIEGETLASIALAEGFHDARKLFDAPENAALREQRGRPELVEPGDEVFIPDLIPFKTVVTFGQALVLKRRPQRASDATPDLPELPTNPEDFHFIEVLVTDSDGELVAEEPVIITDSNGKEHEVLTNAQGIARVEGLAAGQVKISLDRGKDDWKVEGVP